MQMLRCECCGGTINRYTMKCDFCDTEYIIDEYKEVKIKICNKPVRKIMAKMALSENAKKMLPEEFIKERLILSLAEQLGEEMKIKESYNPRSMTYDIYGMIEIAKED